MGMSDNYREEIYIAFTQNDKEDVMGYLRCMGNDKENKFRFGTERFNPGKKDYTRKDLSDLLENHSETLRLANADYFMMLAKVKSKFFTLRPNSHGTKVTIIKAEVSKFGQHERVNGLLSKLQEDYNQKDRPLVYDVTRIE